MVALAAGAASGCMRGSLATSTGPNGPQAWSADKSQDAHVGEQVRFSFILVKPWQKGPVDPYGHADYCLADIGGHRVLCEPDWGGRFRFEDDFSDDAPGQTIIVSATA